MGMSLLYLSRKICIACPPRKLFGNFRRLDFRQKSRITKAFRMGPYISGGLDGMDSDRYGWVRTHTDAKFALSSPFPFSRFYDRKNFGTVSDRVRGGGD